MNKLDVLLDLYNHGPSTRFQQSNRIKDYNERLVYNLRDEGLVCFNGRIIKGKSKRRIFALSDAGKSLCANKLTKWARVWSAIKRMASF